MNMKNKSKEALVLNIKQGKIFLENLQDSPDGLMYYCVGPYCWGRDKNALKSAKNARYNGGKGIYSIHLVNNTAEVDSISGGIYYNSKLDGVKINIMSFKQS